MTWLIRALDREADRKAFDCGTEELSRWLQQQARQSVEKRLTSVWIATPSNDRRTVAGYYSLAPYQVAFEDCPENLRKRLPRYPIHVTLLARLAVAKTFQRQGLGGILLVDALRRAWSAAKLVPVQAVLVHAKDSKAAQFYEKYGFLTFPKNSLHLYTPMDSLRTLVE